MSVFHAEVGGRLFMLENEDLCMRCAVKKNCDVECVPRLSIQRAYFPKCH